MLLKAGTRLGNAEGDLALIGMVDLYYDDIPATADQLPRIRRALSAWAHRIGFSTDEVNVLVLATYETMANVVTHAYPHRQGTFDMHAAYRPAQRYVKITVSDHGRWRLSPTNPVGHRGSGLRLIHALAADAAVDPGARGTTVHMGSPLHGNSPRTH
jgi:serine/threonine-protein kinase RsbW